MRVAVYPAEGGCFAYKLGRVQDGVHNHNLLTGKITPLEDLLDSLVKQAQAEYPDAEVRIETLDDSGEEGTWNPVEGEDEE